MDEDLAHIHTPMVPPIYVQIGIDLNHTVQTKVGASTVIYFIDVVMGDDTTHELRFRGCRLTWNRQVAPAPATARFTDVPTTHPPSGSWRRWPPRGSPAAAGANTFCPDAPLTRAQMASFLSVALGLHYPF